MTEHGDKGPQSDHDGQGPASQAWTNQPSFVINLAYDFDNLFEEILNLHRKGKKKPRSEVLGEEKTSDLLEKANLDPIF